jgi:hypothetical protein
MHNTGMFVVPVETDAALTLSLQFPQVPTRHASTRMRLIFPQPIPI